MIGKSKGSCINVTLPFSPSLGHSVDLCSAYKIGRYLYELNITISVANSNLGLCYSKVNPNMILVAMNSMSEEHMSCCFQILSIGTEQEQYFSYAYLCSKYHIRALVINYFCLYIIVASALLHS